MLDNLRFILMHEPELEECEKRWVLNRIADKTVEEECIGLIEASGHGFIRIPFILDDYEGRFLDGSDMPANLLFPVARTDDMNGTLRTWALEWQYRYKSLYAVSLNLARNLALDEGRRLARWTLPWDGSCFFTATAWRELTRLAVSDNTALHLIVPLARVIENEQLLQHGFVPEALAEPQIAFRNDSSERFDENLRYGHLNKAELLRILGVPGPWHGWRMAPWEVRENRISSERGRFVQGGWVARLQSGCDATVEGDDNLRGRSRFRGIQAFCYQLDKQIVAKSLGTDPLFCYERKILAADAEHSSGELITAIIHSAQEALKNPMPSILDKSSCSPSGDKRDYMSVSPYFHTGLNASATYLDGQRNPESILFGETSMAFDRTSLESFINRTCAASLAGALTGDRVYFQYVASMLRQWFITEQTRMNPHMKYAQIIPREPMVGRITGIVDFRNLWALIDAIKLTRQSGELTDDDMRSIKLWFNAFLGDLTRRRVDRQLNNIGSWADLVIASTSAFIGDSGRAARVLSTAPLRMAAQLSAFSAPHLELRRAKPLHYCLFHLQAWICLAWLGRSLGVDLWKYTASLHRSIAMEARFIALNRCCFSDYDTEAETYDQRIAVAVRCIPVDAVDYDKVAALDLPKDLLIFDNPDFGIPPFWPAFRMVVVE